MINKRFVAIIVVLALSICVFQPQCLAQDIDLEKKIEEARPKGHEDIDALIWNERYDEAETLCKQRISQDKEDYAAITQLGEVYWEKDNRRAATKQFKKALKIAPGYSVVHFHLGKSHFFNNEYDEAKAEFTLFREVMDLIPEMDEYLIDYYTSKLHKIAYMYSGQEKYGRMISIYKKILKLDPGDQTASYNLAVSYYHRYHNRSRAYNQLQKTINMDEASRIAARAKLFIDYMRRNPDSRFAPDYTFIFDN